MRVSERLSDTPFRWEQAGQDTGFWVPARSEIMIQYFTRYLFFSLAVIYFSTLDSVRPVLFDIETLLILLGVYFVHNSISFHLALQRVTLTRIRVAMFADLLVVTLCVAHDPNAIPPSALAFLMVLLGNGMRYGMRVFAEVLAGAVLGMAIAFALRYRYGGFEVTAGDVFFGLFWVVLALYAFLLMGRIDGQRRQLDLKSRFDALTGLLNRHGLLAASENVFHRDDARMPATVLFADLDQFKAVNDQFGHAAGDRVLSEFARIFSESVDMGVCGRWGGDEFVALLPLRDDDAVEKIFDRIQMRAAAWSHSHGLPMAVSLGVAHAPRDGHDLPTLLAVADIHLYQSKARSLTSEPSRITSHEPKTA